MGIGKVTSESIPATKFYVNGEPIASLPLINDTIRSIKRFSLENGEYLIGVDWQVAVPREQAAWKANAGLYTTALVCASLKNQQSTIYFVYKNLISSSTTKPIAGIESDQEKIAQAKNLYDKDGKYFVNRLLLHSSDKLQTVSPVDSATNKNTEKPAVLSIRLNKHIGTIFVLGILLSISISIGSAGFILFLLIGIPVALFSYYRDREEQLRAGRVNRN